MEKYFIKFNEDEPKYVQISDNIKNSELLILEDEGHFSYMINCKWYDRLKKFLER